jgi:hypothetical protein
VLDCLRADGFGEAAVIGTMGEGAPRVFVA